MIEYFPDPHPDEILYSVWARYSDHVRCPNKGDVHRELFGSKSDHVLVDWSCSLGYLVDQLSAEHGYTVDTLINGHTIFPLYAPFLPPERQDRLCHQMISGNGAALSARLGMLTSHAPPHRWLRFCPACVKSDRERLGETYWHRLHQAPGVEVCPVHIAFLEDSTAERQSGRRTFIPAEHAVHQAQPRSAAGDPLCQFMLDIAKCTDHLLHNAYTSPGPEFFRCQYISLLQHHGLITIKGSLRVVEYLKVLTDYYPPSFLSLLHCELNRTKHIEAEWPARLPFARKPQHPLHHILVIRSLGATIEAFFNSPFQASRPFGDGPWPCLNPVCGHYRDPCIAEYSVRANSPKNRPVALFAYAFCGFTYSRVGPDGTFEDTFKRDRIPAYGYLWQAKLQGWWLNPEISIERIARCLGTDFNTVKRQAKRLALPPRRATRPRSTGDPLDGKKLAECREEWSQLIELHAKAGITALTRRSRHARTIYNWLNKHDRPWLLAHRPATKIPQRTKAHLHATFRANKEAPEKSRREERDSSTSQAIRSVANQITNSPGEPRRVTRVLLEKAAPGVGWLLSSPEDFPLTAQAFREVRETREAFAFRRIRWTLQRYKEESIKPTRREFVLRAKARRVQDAPPVRSAIEEALASFGSI